MTYPKPGEAVQNGGHLGGYIVGGDWGTWAPEVWQALIDKYRPYSVLDVGCGEGHSTKWFKDKGLVAMGIEGWPAAIVHSPVPHLIRLHDYTKRPFKPVVWDMAWSCEFVEHVEEKYVDNFMATFEKCRVVAMTHALPGQGGVHHVNCQPPEYWIEQFRRWGHECDMEEALRLRALLVNGNGGYVKNTLLVFKSTLLR